MKPQFICHPDFAQKTPINVFHKEKENSKFDVPDAKFYNRHILFRKKIILSKAKSAILRISADDYYKLYINGKFVTQGPAPSYPNAYYYNELDVSEFLNIGENTFAIHTYYQGLINRVWVSGDLRQMLWLSLDIDGKNALVSDTTWRCTDHSGYTALGEVGYHTAVTECYNSAASEDNFQKTDFDDSNWEYAAIYQNADYILQKQPTRQLAFSSLPPVKTEAFAGGVRVDFGREAVGYLSLTAKGNAGDKLNAPLWRGIER